MRPIICLFAVLVTSAVPGADGPSAIRDITWTKAPALNFLIKGPVVGVIGDKLLCVGGTQIPTRVLEERKAHLKRQPLGHGYLLVVDDKDPKLAEKIRSELRVCGGSMVTDRVWLLDPRIGTYEDLPAAPEFINWPWGISAGDELFVLPQMPCRNDGNPSLVSREVWRFSRKSGAWKWDRLPPFLYARVWPGLAVVGTTLIAAGGGVVFDQENALVFQPRRPGVGINAVQALNTATPEKGWYELPPIPGGPRSLFAMTAVGRRVYVFGGFYGKSWINYGDLRGYYSDAYVLDLDELRWRKLPDFPFRTYGLDAAVYQDRYVILTGGMKIGHVEPTGATAENWTGYDEGNFDVVVFDTKLESYRTLPTRVPPFPLTQEGVDLIAGWKAKVPPHDWMATYDFSKGIYRQSPKLRLIGDKLYLLGGDVVGNPKNASDELLVGTIVR